VFNKNNSIDQIKNLKSLAGSIAHETRNPLSAILGCCEIIKTNLDEAVEYLDLISTSATRGLSMIDMILQNIKDGEIDKTKFIDLSIAGVIESAIKEYAFENGEQKKLVNVTLKGDFANNLKNDSVGGLEGGFNSAGDFTFRGDKTLMIFVLFNLLKNSLYYQAKIDIWLDSDKKCLYFKDNGVGIAADKLGSIFDDFVTANKKGGTGLGLPFCKRVMISFGGDIFCKSVEGQGVEFCLQF
jgi:two-component system CAI-1 autoinducer sensor kinase/phosphatase CqsS